MSVKRRKSGPRDSNPMTIAPGGPSQPGAVRSEILLRRWCRKAWSWCAGGRGVLRGVFFVAVLFLAACLQLGIPRTAPPTPAPTPPASAGLNDDARTMLLKQYDNATAEIRQRLEHEGTLFAFKFTLVGAVLAFLLGKYWKEGTTLGLDDIAQSPVAASFFWCAVIASAIIDARINFNVAIIQSIGHWVRVVVEPAVYGSGPPAIRGWERFLETDDSSIFKAEFYYVLRFNMTLLTYVLFCATCSIFVFGRGVLPSKNAVQGITAADLVSLVGALISFGVFAIVSLQFNGATYAAFQSSTVICIVGVMCSVLLWTCTTARMPRSGGVANYESA
jgi:hypothetical protein